MDKVEKVIYRIKRYDGNKEWFQEYEINYEKGKTILWGLIKIKEEQDPTLNFISACRSAICGSCGVRVNGNGVLACKTSLDKMLEIYETNKLTLEPLANYKVIRDLVVDWEPKFERIKEVKPWLIPDSEKCNNQGFRQSEEEFNIISSPTDCILCGLCVSECTQHTVNSDGFYEPFIFTKAYRFIADSRDNGKKDHLLPALNKGGLWKCVRCMQCVTKCPKELKPGEHISSLRRESMKLGYTKNKGARHAYAFYRDIEKNGRLNEITLPIKTEGVIGSIRRIPFAIRLLKKGKIEPLHFPKPVKGIDGIKRVYKLSRREEN